MPESNPADGKAKPPANRAHTARTLKDVMNWPMTAEWTVPQL